MCCADGNDVLEVINKRHVPQYKAAYKIVFSSGWSDPFIQGWDGFHHLITKPRLALFLEGGNPNEFNQPMCGVPC